MMKNFLPDFLKVGDEMRWNQPFDETRGVCSESAKKPHELLLTDWTGDWS